MRKRSNWAGLGRMGREEIWVCCSDRKYNFFFLGNQFRRIYIHFETWKRSYIRQSEKQVFSRQYSLLGWRYPWSQQVAIRGRQTPQGWGELHYLLLLLLLSQAMLDVGRVGLGKAWTWPYASGCLNAAKHWYVHKGGWNCWKITNWKQWVSRYLSSLTSRLGQLCSVFYTLASWVSSLLG